jgi:hypothetical protein
MHGVCDPSDDGFLQIWPALPTENELRRVVPRWCNRWVERPYFYPRCSLPCDWTMECCLRLATRHPVWCCASAPLSCSYCEISKLPLLSDSPTYFTDLYTLMVFKQWQILQTRSFGKFAYTITRFLPIFSFYRENIFTSSSVTFFEHS